MQSTLNQTNPDAWAQLAPLLDDAMAELSETDRTVLVLRYFENQTARETAASLRMEEDTVQKRATRALEKLRKFFTRRGVALSAAAIAGAVSANSVQAAPAGLAVKISLVAAKGAMASGSTLALVKGAWNLMMWGKVKMAAVIGSALLLTASTTIIILDQSNPSRMDAFLPDANLTHFRTAPPMAVVQPTHVLEAHGAPTITMGRKENEKLIGRDISFKLMFSTAYGIDWPHLLFLTDAPTNNYDYLVTETNRAHERLQAEIKKVTGYAGRKEVRPVEVYLLKANPEAPTKLRGSNERYTRYAKSDPAGYGKGSTIYHGNYNSYPTLPALIADLEYRFGKPVLDRTGMTNHSGLVVDWDFNRIHIPKGYFFAQAMREHNETLKQALHDQLGLELVPSREPVEVLVVEKVK